MFSGGDSNFRPKNAMQSGATSNLLGLIQGQRLTGTYNRKVRGSSPFSHGM